MNLFDIDTRIRACVIDGDRAVDTETGEVIDLDALKALEMERDAKVENIALWIKELKAEAEALKTEADVLTRRREVAKNKAESLSGYLQAYLNGQKFKTVRVAITYRKSDPLQIAPDAVIPEQYLRIKTEPDKARLKADIKAGKVKIDGVWLADVKNMIIK